MAVPGRRGQLTSLRMLADAEQNEAQAFVPEHVNQDVSGTHLPATAWPRQVCPPRANGYVVSCRLGVGLCGLGVCAFVWVRADAPRGLRAQADLYARSHCFTVAWRLLQLPADANLMWSFAPHMHACVS